MRGRSPQLGAGWPLGQPLYSGLSVPPPPVSALRVIDEEGMDRLSTAGAAGIDAFLMGRVNFLRRSYGKFGDPRLIFLAAEPLAARISALPSSSASFQFSNLLALIAEMLLAEGRDRITLGRAKFYIERAFDVLLKLDLFSGDVAKAYISNGLHYGVILKSLGQHDDALSIMRVIRELSQQKLSLSPADVVMLDRQEVLMHQDRSLFFKMALQAGSYAAEKPLEYFGTIKRVF